MRSVRVEGLGARVVVGTVYCFGKNYRAHAIEMGQTEPKPPVVFLKPAAALVVPDGTIAIPTDRGEVHHEAELVLALDIPEELAGRALEEADADRCIVAYTIGLDLTLRDEQSRAKSAGEPWAASKGFPGSAPIAELRRRAPGEVWSGMTLTLDVDGERRQEASLETMTLSPAASVAHLSRVFPLASGDLVFTGTPAGVGPLSPGSRVTAALEPGPRLEVEVIATEH
jgi:fumarylpyruvate hydrolase